MPWFIFTVSIGNVDISAETWKCSCFSSEEQPQHCRQGGAWTCPHLLLGIPMRTELGFMIRLTSVCSGLVFQQETPVNSPQKTDPSQGQHSSRPTCSAVPALPGAEGHVGTSSLTSGSPLQVVLDRPSFMNEKHCKVDATFVMAVIFLMCFPVRWDSGTLLITCGKGVGWKVNDWASNSHSPGKSHWNTRWICRLWVCPSYDFALPLSGSRVKNMVKWNFPEEMSTQGAEAERKISKLAFLSSAVLCCLS